MARKYTTLRQVRLTGPLSEVKAALQWCFRNGYRARRSGPKIRYGRVSLPPQYLIIAIKEIEPRRAPDVYENIYSEGNNG